MPKDNVCKHCGAINQHYSFQCHTQRKPIKKSPTKIGDYTIAKRTPIAKVSDKEKVRLAKYRKERDAYFKEHPICEFPKCQSLDITLHHGKGRTGDLLFNKRYFKSLCLKHHEYVENNRLEAIELGLSFKRLED